MTVGSQQTFKNMFALVLSILIVVIIIMLLIIFLLINYTCKITCSCSRNITKEESGDEKTKYEKREKCKKKRYCVVLTRGQMS